MQTANRVFRHARTIAPCSSRPTGRLASARNTRLRIAAIEEQTASFDVNQEGLSANSLLQTPIKAVAEIDPQVGKDLEIEELDAAQEQMLKWMALDEREQDEDLDEMVDYDEFGDDEYEELFEEVEELYETADVDLKVGDTVVGTVYEIDEEGAYVEIGQKSSGFVPLSECSFAKLKTVRGGKCMASILLFYAEAHNPAILPAQGSPSHWNEAGVHGCRGRGCL
jgi:hypothetical protein